MAIKITINGFDCVITEQDGYPEIRREGAAKSARDRHLVLTDSNEKAAPIYITVESASD